MKTQIKWVKTRHPGVRFREHHTRKVKRHPDRSFQIFFKRKGKVHSEVIGWESEGITEEEAVRVRAELLKNIRWGEGHQSLREKRELEQKRRDEEQRVKDEAELENTRFDILAQKYLDWSRHSKKSFRDDVSRYENHIGPALGETPIRQISVIHLERFKRDLQGKGLADNTIKHCLCLVRQIFNRGKSWGLFEGENPVRETTKTDKKFLKTRDTKRLSFFSKQEAFRLLKILNSRSAQTADIALLSFHTGMRAGEIFDLIWADLDLQHEVIHIKNPKNDESRQAYMTPQVREMFEGRMEENPDKSELIFKNRKGKRISEISNAFQNTVDEMGLNKGVADRQNKLVFHSVRHSFGSWLAIQETPIYTIKELMGHKSIELTMRYAHLLPDMKRRAVLKLGEVEVDNIKDLEERRK